MCRIVRWNGQLGNHTFGYCPSTAFLETDVCVWCYALLVVFARKNEQVLRVSHTPCSINSLGWATTIKIIETSLQVAVHSYHQINSIKALTQSQETYSRDSTCTESVMFEVAWFRASLVKFSSAAINAMCLDWFASWKHQRTHHSPCCYTTL